MVVGGGGGGGGSGAGGGGGGAGGCLPVVVFPVDVDGVVSDVVGCAPESAYWPWNELQTAGVFGVAQ